MGSVTKYKLTIAMPKLDFPLLVELSTAINDFSFMKIHDVNIGPVGANIGVGDGGNKQPVAKFYKSPDVDFYDRAVLDFGNLTVKPNLNINVGIQLTWAVFLGWSIVSTPQQYNTIQQLLPPPASPFFVGYFGNIL